MANGENMEERQQHIVIYFFAEPLPNAAISGAGSGGGPAGVRREPRRGGAAAAPTYTPPAVPAAFAIPGDGACKFQSIPQSAPLDTARL